MSELQVGSILKHNLTGIKLKVLDISKSGAIKTKVIDNNNDSKFSVGQIIKTYEKLVGKTYTLLENKTMKIKQSQIDKIILEEAEKVMKNQAPDVYEKIKKLAEVGEKIKQQIDNSFSHLEAFFSLGTKTRDDFEFRRAVAEVARVQKLMADYQVIITSAHEMAEQDSKLQQQIQEPVNNKINESVSVDSMINKLVANKAFQDEFADGYGEDSTVIDFNWVKKHLKEKEIKEFYDSYILHKPLKESKKGITYGVILDFDGKIKNIEHSVNNKEELNTFLRNNYPLYEVKKVLVLKENKDDESLLVKELSKMYKSNPMRREGRMQEIEDILTSKFGYTSSDIHAAKTGTMQIGKFKHNENKSSSQNWTKEEAIEHINELKKQLKTTVGNKNKEYINQQIQNWTKYLNSLKENKINESTTYQKGDKVIASSDVQKLKKGEEYIVTDVEENNTPFGNFVTYYVKGKDGKEIPVVNGHLLLSKSKVNEANLDKNIDKRQLAIDIKNNFLKTNDAIKTYKIIAKKYNESPVDISDFDKENRITDSLDENSNLIMRKDQSDLTESIDINKIFQPNQRQELIQKISKEFKLPLDNKLKKYVNYFIGDFIKNMNKNELDNFIKNKDKVNFLFGEFDFQESMQKTLTESSDIIHFICPEHGDKATYSPSEKEAICVDRDEVLDLESIEVQNAINKGIKNLKHKK